jgi:hypothetical protein
VHTLHPPHTTQIYDVAVLLRDKVWRYHGFPEEIVSETGILALLVNSWIRYTTQQGVSRLEQQAYHPQSDGQTERVNRILEDYLKHYTRDKPKEWEDYLAVAEFAYNNSWQASIKYHTISG